jgi:protease I
MIIAPEKFRDEELFVPKVYFEKLGWKIDVASTKKGICTGVLGGTVESTQKLDEVGIDNYDAIIYVGGPGTPIIRREETALKIAREANSQGKLVCAICWAPTTLAKAGILKGKRSAVWVGNDSEYGKTTDEVMKSFGAIVVKEQVVEDGNIITADGPKSALEFAKLIEKKLVNK